MDVVRLRGLRLHAVLGDLPHERLRPQPLDVDVEVGGDWRPVGETDRLDRGVDYRAVYHAVLESVSSSDTDAPRLLEAQCERIASRVLAIDGVQRVVVRCRKPWAELPGPSGTVEVEIERP